MIAADTVRKNVVLVGGGHAHVQVLKSFGMSPEPGVRLTLVASEIEAPYSGMLPGHVAGHYERDAIHIDLVRLARFAGARLIHAPAIGVDRVRRRLLLADRPPLAYDLLSFDIGITPALSDIRDPQGLAIPVKPVSTFGRRWGEVEARALQAQGPRRFVVVGGGAAGLEVVLAIAHRLRTRASAAGIDASAFSFTLVAGANLLPSHNAGARRLARSALAKRGVALIENTPAVEIDAQSCRLADGRALDADAVLVTTGAVAAPWLAASGLPCVDGGFLSLRPTLQLEDNDDIFAAGDCGTVRSDPNPKAGVYAVRQGPILTENLRRRVHGRALLRFRPQRRFLTILALGDHDAIAARGAWALAGPWVWRWKDRIDRDFMTMFQDLPAMGGAVSPASRASIVETMRCGGCAAKVGPRPLAAALDRLTDLETPQAAGACLASDQARDDAAVIDDGGAPLRLESIDYFRAFWPEPYVLGAVAANHALGDIYAMGGTPTHALAVCALPHAAPDITAEDLFQLLAGARHCFDAHGVRLVGGHSSEGPELAVGFFVSGCVERDRLLRKGGLRRGDALILTKPLGTGLVFAAEMRGAARGGDLMSALQSMRRSNADAAATLLAHDARAMTDVTGFGLAGHLIEMLAASKCEARLAFGRLPLLPGAAELAASGIASTLVPENAQMLGAIADGARLTEVQRAILFDPQTAGGLLAGVPAERAEAAVQALRAGPAPAATVIGSVGAAVAVPGPPLLRIDA